MNEQSQPFKARVARSGNRVYIELPFDAIEVWGKRDRYHVSGTVNGTKVRGALEAGDGGYQLVLGPAWRRDAGISPGDEVMVELAPEGPQTEQLAPDLVAALEAEPDARRFFESLPTFYRKAYLTWIDGTKRRPEERVRRLNELVELLNEGKKEP